VPISSTSTNLAHTNNNTNNNNAAAVGAAHSYNQWVAQAAVNNNHASNSAPRFPPPSQHPPPPPYHGGMQHGIMPPQYAAMGPQPPQPPPQFQQVLLTNPAAAAPYVYHPPRNDQPTTTTNNNNNNPVPQSNTAHPSFSYLSMTAAANPTATTTATTNHPPQQLIPPPPNAAQISQALAARYAARAMNGGHEPNTAQIVEMMNRMNAAPAGAAGGSVAMLGNSGAVSGYINHSNYASLGSGNSGAAGTNVVHSSSAAPPQPRAAKRQRTTTQPQQKKRRFTTGTTLTIHNSIIPCSTGGVKSIDSKTVLEEITRRVRNECAILSLLPSDEFIADKRERGELVGSSISSKNKWLRCAVTLVYSSLNLESPNPVGWDEGIITDLDENTVSGTKSITTATSSKKKRGGGGRVKRAHWFKGLYHKLCGPQPWQCTRPFVAKAVYQLLLAEGCTDWLISEHRWGAMERMVRPIIAVNLSIWKPQVFGNRGDVLKTHSKLIWRQYRADQLRTIQDCEKALVPPQIGCAYVRHVANCSDWPILRTVEKKKKKKESAASEGEVIDLSTTVVEVSPDPVPMCVPVGEANNNGVNFMWESKWTCDYCSASFSDYDEAVTHENECKERSQTAEAANDDESKPKESLDTEQTDNDGDGVVENHIEFAMEEKWKCDYCPKSFAVYDEAVAHESECKAKSQAAEVANDDESKTKEIPDTDQTMDDVDAESHVEFAMEEKWNCDYCSASFAVYDEAAAHEAECKSKSQLAEVVGDDESKTKEGPVTKETMGDGVVESSVEDEAAANEAECKSKSQLAEAADDDESKTKESPVTKETMDDGADVVESSVEDEAVAHETECKAKSQLAESANDEESKTKGSHDKEQTIDDGDGVVESSAEDEAVAHENECKAQSRVVELVDEENEVKVNSGASDDDAEVHARGWRCDYCPASFSVYDEAVAHENECKAKSQGEEEKKAEEVVGVTETNVEANQSCVEGKGGFIVEEKWKCDYCSASFSVFDEAVLHESECKAKMQSAVVDDATTGKENQTSDEFGKKKVDHVVEEQWQCDYCEARFSDFDEAAAHEAECKRMSEAATSLPSSSSVSNRDADTTPQHAGLLDAVNGTDFFAADKLRSSMLKTLENLHYEYFPLMSGGDKKLGEVCEKVLRCLHAVTPINKENEIASKRRVECVLNHLEHRSGYLSNLNGIFRLRVNTTALMDDSNPESPDEDVISLLSDSEDPEEIVVTYGLNSDGDQVIMAANSPEGAAEEGAAKSRMPQRIDTAIFDRSTPCGECILCNAPDCERCFVCLSKGRAETDVCIRKSCCKIPFENKAKSLVGFPPEWQYAFCDPNQGVLVKSPRRILSLAGLVIRRPMLAAFQTPGYQYFHSFEAAFSSVQHEDTSEATKLVESFLSHVHGSDAMKSYPKHFLVGRRFCFEFTNVNGMNVAMFGVISTCFRESSEAETDIFMVQYDSDCIEIAAKSLGTTILRLQLISSEQAWGGCISFERKARIRGRHSVVRSIDQATAVEYWVTPDMRMEEMVEQDDGIKVPMLTILLRGYKFVFSAHNDDEGIAVSVSCISMNVDDGTADESILKPGELIDLGVFCPLSDSDTKPLPVFLLKNYVHNFSIDSYAGDGNGNVYDLFEDAKGTMHLAATKKVLSYVRSCNDTEVPTIHGGLDPSGKVHLLFGVRYRGDWKEYTSIMEEEIQPIFRGEQKEVTLARNAMINEQQEARYLSAMKNFGPVELLQCAKFIGSLFLGSPTAVPSSGMKERLFRVATCLRHRIAELGDPSINVADQLIQRSIDQVKGSQQQQTVTGRHFAPHIAKTF